tara:strand:+ start:251 stop:457 length:207 start_codon:yes stop_codon:yes gene_type:complete
MNKSTIEDCLAMFKRYDIYAEHYDVDDAILVQTSNPDVYVQISKSEIVWRADQYLEHQKQENEEEKTV